MRISPLWKGLLGGNPRGLRMGETSLSGTLMRQPAAHLVN